MNPRGLHECTSCDSFGITGKHASRCPALRGLHETAADYCARLSDDDLRVFAQRAWDIPCTEDLFPARAEAKKRGLVVA